MTINDAMRALAEKLEPIEQEIIAFPMKVVSPLGFWRGYGIVTGWKWGHIDFLRDEDASAWLLDAMASENTVAITLKSNLQKVGKILRVHVDIEWLEIHAVHREKRTAVFLAALAWKGIERPEGL